MKNRKQTKVKTLPIAKDRDNYKELTDFLLRAMKYNHGDKKLYMIAKDNFDIDGRKLRPLIKNLRSLNEANNQARKLKTEEQHLSEQIEKLEQLYEMALMSAEPDKAARILKDINVRYYQLKYLKDNEV